MLFVLVETGVESVDYFIFAQWIPVVDEAILGGGMRFELVHQFTDGVIGLVWRFDWEYGGHKYFITA
jgi:hypothetical protein